jgi:hypothetical protein
MDDTMWMLVALFPLVLLVLVYARIVLYGLTGHKPLLAHIVLDWVLAVLGSCAVYWLL